MERFRFGEREGHNGKVTTVNGWLAIFGAQDRCHLELDGPNGGERAMIIMDKATAGKLGAALLKWAMPDNKSLRAHLGDVLAAYEAVTEAKGKAICPVCHEKIVFHGRGDVVFSCGCTL